MERGFSRPALAAAAVSCLLMTACGSFSIWPFGGTAQERSRVPSDATEYQCPGGKRFYLRAMDGGNSTWVILPDREFRLDKVDSAGGTRFGNGVTVLELNAGEASLSDGSATAYTGCKAAGK
jgi:membrane-bound inhibitor of C-type lysozyme